MAAGRAGKSVSLNFNNFTTKEPTFSRGRRNEKTIEIYWKELCCQEKSSQSRNKALLDDFERIEKQSAALEAQTEKLKQLKDQYEGYINTMYPRWLHELKRHQQKFDHDRNGADGQESQTQEAFRPNNVRFASPPEIQPKQERFLTSDLYKSQNTTDYPNDTTDYPDNTYHQQTSHPYGTARGRTLDWDSYHRDSSLDFYQFGQASHLNDYMRFSTPYNSSHIGPWVAANGFNQSFDLAYGSGRTYHQRHPSMGSPIRYNGPAPPVNGRGRPYNEENSYLVSESIEMSYHQPKSSRQQYGPPHSWFAYYQSQGDQRPGETPQSFRQEDRHSSFGNHQDVYQGRREVQHGYLQAQHVEDDSPKSCRENRHKNKDQVIIAPGPPASDTKSPSSSPSSPFDSPEKPLDSTMDLKAQTQGNNYVCHKNEDLTKKKSPKSPRHSLDIETPEELEQENLSTFPGSSLAFSDLEPRLPQLATDKQSKNKQGIDQEIVSKKAGHPDHKQQLNKEVLNGSIKPVDNDNILDLLSDGTLSSGDDSELSYNDYTPSLIDVSNNGLIKTSNTIPTENKISTSDSKLKPEKNIEKVSNKHFSTNDTEITTFENEDNASKSSVVTEQGGVDVKPSMSRQEVCPSVSVKGSLLLLRVIDADIKDSLNPETFYHAPKCSQEMRDDIIKCAESGSSLDIYDPSVLSVVLLDELSKLSRGSPSGGLISTDNMEYANTEPQLLRNVIDPSLSPLWDDLMAHMVRLVEYNIMGVDEVSRLFSVSLLALDSSYTNKFQTVLAGLIRDSIDGKVMKGHEVESAGKDKEQPTTTDNRSVTSEESSTLGSTPPPSGKQDNLPIDDSPPTPQTLDRSLSYEDDFEQEDDIPLTETAAYKKLMSTTESDLLGNRKVQEEESEGDDDLERTLARSISPPVVSPRQRSPVPSKPVVSGNNKSRGQKPKLSIFSGDSLGLSYGSEDLGDSWGASSGRLSSTAKSDITGKTASPPSSPDLDTGYVPTALEDNKKKDDSVPKKSTRKPGFWNHSDTESEVDLQLSTGALGDEDDDFDFYG